MAMKNRPYWFEWLGGIGGALIFFILGIMAIAQRHIVLAGRISGPSPTDGSWAILLGAVLLICAWWCLIVVFRATTLRRVWVSLALVVLACAGAAAYGGAFDF
jgi:hypothetical protein